MRNNLSDRFLEFAANAIKLGKEPNKDFSGQHIYRQLIRSSTSAGANYEEAVAAESRKDFVHKMQIVLKELRESYYWLQLIEKSNLITKSVTLLNDLLRENKELLNIIGKSVVMTKKNAK